MDSARQHALPSVDRLVQSLAPTAIPRPLIVDLARRLLTRCRAAGDCPTFDALVEELGNEVASLGRSRLQPVINATGILAHTNLGRAPLSSASATAAAEAASGYCNLEIDLDTGSRGSRARYLELCLATAFGAEAATVVNNCAAALVLLLCHLTRGPRKEVLLSRGELVQIGGGFRIPEILETTGARLREVGTTNQTTVEDYRRAIGPETALLLRVHRSNFFQEGFVGDPSRDALAALARERGVPFVEDLGSGALIDPATFSPVASEPRPQDALHAGVDLVCFSGDKLFGGPQAGIIAGRPELVANAKRDPFFRALRCDKLVLTALQSTVEHYLHATARKDLGPPGDLPMVALLRVSPEELQPRADRLKDALSDLPVETAIRPCQSQVGGGVCPKSSLPSVCLALRHPDLRLETLATRLRVGHPPVVAFLADGWCQFDLRTVFPHQDDALLTALRTALSP